MLKHVDMMGKASLVFDSATNEPATVGEIAWFNNQYENSASTPVGAFSLETI